MTESVCVQKVRAEGERSKDALENHFTLGTFPLTLESALASELRVFIPFFLTEDLGVFSSCFFLGGFYKKRKKNKVTEDRTLAYS